MSPDSPPVSTPRRRCFSFPRSFRRFNPNRNDGAESGVGGEPQLYNQGNEGSDRFDPRRVFNRYFGNRRRNNPRYPPNEDFPDRTEVEYV